MNQLKWTATDPAVSRDTVLSVERIFGVKFPEDYINLAKEYHGGYPNFDVLDMGNEELPFNRLLSYDPEDSYYVESVHGRIRDRLVDHVFPFASDDFGNFYCFDYRQNKEKPTIVFWDHEGAFLNKEKGIMYICDSFTDFLSKLRPYED